MSEISNEALARRLARMEGECRRWTLLGCGAVSIAAVLIAAGGARPSDEPADPGAERIVVGELEAKRIVLKDEAGDEWFRLERRSGVTQMEMHGADLARPRPERPVCDERPRVQEHIGRETARPARILFVVNKDATPYIAVTGHDGASTTIGVSPGGEAYVSTSGMNGSTGLWAAGSAKGETGVRVRDAGGREPIRPGLRRDGTAAFEMQESTTPIRHKTAPETSKGSEGREADGPRLPEPDRGRR